MTRSPDPDGAKPHLVGEPKFKSHHETVDNQTNAYLKDHFVFDLDAALTQQGSSAV